MHSSAAATASAIAVPAAHVMAMPTPPARAMAQAPKLPGLARTQLSAAAQIGDTLSLIGEALAPQRRVVHAGDRIYQAGEAFACLHLMNAGFVKLVRLSADGREQVVSLKFRGDWLGFDGIAHGHYGCDAVAMDTGEVWSVRYDALVAASLRQPALLTVLHQAMSREITRDRDSLMSVCTLPADARVADFLRYWAESLAKRGLRTDQFTLRMSRAEIGNYLGMTLETVSRALSRLARDGIICFAEKGRREVQIPDVSALSAFVQRCLSPVADELPAAPTLQ
ncbi:Crp/Fnr family transcriptional regulator [Ideonella azotifigens]|nr:Crp/Fnr family transcriptional regulator [Ideonella azotifigens]MCD2341142.1 Crp/Fnr family transcriptional regulator [Ideonella azotifigens]